MRSSYWVKLAAIAVVVVALCAGGGDAPGAEAIALNSITSPDTTGTVGSYPSLQLDGSGNPVVSYYDLTNRDLKVMHCNDVNCAGGDESIVAPDTSGSVGLYTSLALDADGYPVVSYIGSGVLKVMHCNDPNCAGGDESIVAPDPLGGGPTSMALDVNGYPVIAYGQLRILHCNDPNCAGGDDSIALISGTGGASSQSLVLDESGFPVVGFFNSSGNAWILHCNDVNCTGGDESLVGSLGHTEDSSAKLSLALDTDGFPVMSLPVGPAEAALRILHCDDPNCSPGGESYEPVNVTGTGEKGFTSLKLDTSGFPVVAWGDYAQFAPKVIHCNDVNCAGADESITSPDQPDHYVAGPSLELDLSGNPVVAYFDGVEGELKILHCGAPTCTPDADGDSVLDTSDNCPLDPNSGQENADENFIDQTPPSSQDDRTWPNSDGDGDACDSDDDDDNDGLSDSDETSGAACGSIATDPLLRDTDGDRVLDGAECALGTDPTSAGSKPTPAQCGSTADADGDRLSERAEVCGYNTNPDLADTDGDQDGYPTTGPTKDGCEAASLNNDRLVNAGDQLLLVLEILREPSPSLRLASFDINKDGVVNAGDQLIIAGFIAVAGACP